MVPIAQDISLCPSGRYPVLYLLKETRYLRGRVSRTVLPQQLSIGLAAVTAIERYLNFSGCFESRQPRSLTFQTCAHERLRGRTNSQRHFRSGSGLAGFGKVSDTK